MYNTFRVVDHFIWRVGNKVGRSTYGGVVMGNILAVDDEQGILVLIKKILTMDGHQVTIVSDPNEVADLDIYKFDLIILDVMMPGKDGFQLCSEIRDKVDCPILFLTAKTDENGVVDGLSVGGDDYICKPFRRNELCARVNAHLRREHREKVSRLSFEGCYFNLGSKEMYVGDEKMPLTKSEYMICEYLAKNNGQTFSREQVYEAVFGFDGESNDSTIAMHVKNIRTKIETDDFAPIKTVWGIGYKWDRKA